MDMVKFCYASFNLIHTANHSNGYRSDFSTLGDTKHKNLILVPQPTPQSFYFHLYPTSANTLAPTHQKGRVTKDTAAHSPVHHLPACKATLTGQALQSSPIRAVPACLHLFWEQVACKRPETLWQGFFPVPKPGRSSIRPELGKNVMQMGKDFGRREIYITVTFVQLRKDLPSEAVLGSHSLPGCCDKAQSAV